VGLRNGTVENLVNRHVVSSFWNNRRVLVTGHTGFKGGWLCLWLQQLGAEVFGIGLDPETSPNLFESADVAASMDSKILDIRNFGSVAACLEAWKPEIVFHLAAQPLVRKSYRDPLDTFSTNVLGTANVLNAIRACPSTRVAVMITTDKVYRNREWPHPYREEDVIGGHDPYSASKAGAEIVTDCFRSSYLRDQGVAVATARAGNVIGGGDWSEDRLIPDAIRAWQTGSTLKVRRPDSVRPWQHVLEPLFGYLLLAEKLSNEPALAGAYNFGPDPSEAASVRDVVEQLRASYGQGDVSYGDFPEGPHEAGLLVLEIAKARRELGFSPRWNLRETVEKTMKWYWKFSRGGSARALCESDITDYTNTTN